MRKIVKPQGVFWTKPHSTHPLVLKKLQNEIFYKQKLGEIQESLEVLNSETRLRILFLLRLKESLCVGDIADTLRLSTSAVSHQLRILRQGKAVINRRKGKVIYYSLFSSLPPIVSLILKSQS